MRILTAFAALLAATSPALAQPGAGAPATPETYAVLLAGVAFLIGVSLSGAVLLRALAVAK